MALVTGAAGEAQARQSGGIRAPMDATTVLSIFMALMLGIRSDLSVSALGGAGAPSALLGLGMLLWWMWHRLHSGRPKHDWQRWPPVQVALALFIICVLISFVLASIAPLPVLEANGADKALIQMAAFAGIILVAHDGIPSRDRFIVLMRRIALFGGLYAALGLIQFVTRRSWVSGFTIPGLQPSGFGGIDLRDGFVRASATAIHSVEYAMVLTMILPVALTLALRDTKRSFAARWFPASTLLVAAGLSVSRSALLGLLVVMIVLVLSWRPTERWIAVAAGIVGLAGMWILMPGMAGTLLGMFDGSDPSITSRTDSYGLAFSFIKEHPLFGRGLGTFLPSYRIVDNQYLGLLVMVGIVGTAAFLLIIFCALGTVLSGRARTESSLHRELGIALFAMVLGGALLTAFFDSFSFPQACGMLMLALGLCGAYRTLATPVPDKPNQEELVSNAGSHPLGNALRKNWYIALIAAALVLSFAPQINAAKGVYWMKFDVVFLLPPGASDENALRNGSGNIVPYAAMIERQFRGSHDLVELDTNGAPLYGTGTVSGQSVYLPNVGGQWQAYFKDPSITVEVVAPSNEEALSMAQHTVATLQEMAIRPQADIGVKKAGYITTRTNPESPTTYYVDVRTRRGLAGLLLLAGAGGAVAAVIAQELRKAIELKGARRRATDVARTKVKGNSK